jgi:hypothetical protein
MAQTEGGSIRIAKAADAAAIAIIHVESWRETYTGIVPEDVLAGLSVDQRTATWHRILCDPTTFYSSAVFVAERRGAIFGFACCGMQRSETLRAQGYEGEVSSIYILHSSAVAGRHDSARTGARADTTGRGPAVAEVPQADSIPCVAAATAQPERVRARSMRERAQASSRETRIKRNPSDGDAVEADGGGQFQAPQRPPARNGHRRNLEHSGQPGWPEQV